jgi:hypothetical protein
MIHATVWPGGIRSCNRKPASKLDTPFKDKFLNVTCPECLKIGAEISKQQEKTAERYERESENDSLRKKYPGETLTDIKNFEASRLRRKLHNAENEKEKRQWRSRKSK